MSEPERTFSVERDERTYNIDIDSRQLVVAHDERDYSVESESRIFGGVDLDRHMTAGEYSLERGRWIPDPLEIFGADLTWWAENDTIPIGSIATWPDSTGNGFSLSPEAPGQEPTGVADALDGRARIEPDRVNDILRYPGVSTIFARTDPFGFFAILRTPPTFAAPWSPIWSDDPGGGTFYFSTDAGLALHVLFGFSGLLTAASAFTVSTDYLIEIYRDASGFFTVWSNGVDVTSGTPQHATNIGFTGIIGSGGVNNPDFYDAGAVTERPAQAEVSASEKASLRGYYNSIFPSIGITLP